MTGCTPRSIRELLRAGSEALRSSGVDTPILDAEVLLASATGMTRTHLITHPDDILNTSAIRSFQKMLDRRTKREPLAYITEEREFFGRPFKVSRSVMVPRPETEGLVEIAVRFLKTRQDPSVADIGTGSGVIAVSLAAEVPSSVLYASDISEEALSVAEDNAVRHGVRDRVHFLKGDLLDPLEGLVFDMIVSNPPYISSGEIDDLQPEISGYEPRGALAGGPDGLAFYRRLAPGAAAHLKRGGMLAVEVGQGQSAPVTAAFRESGFTTLDVVSDYAGIERVVCGFEVKGPE